MREIFIEYIPDLFFLLVLTCRRLSQQFSLDIHNGYIPGKFRAKNTKTNKLGLNYRLNTMFSLVIHGFPLFYDQRIVKTEKPKTANNKGHLYFACIMSPHLFCHKLLVTFKRSQRSNFITAASNDRYYTSRKIVSGL